MKPGPKPGDIPVKHCPHCYYVMPSACRTCRGCFQPLPRMAKLT